MRYIMFQSEFIEKILNGTKGSTIRPGDINKIAKRFPSGCKVSLRVWDGNPRRSKQTEFAIAEVSRVDKCEIDLQNEILIITG